MFTKIITLSKYYYHTMLLINCYSHVAVVLDNLIFITNLLSLAFTGCSYRVVIKQLA